MAVAVGYAPLLTTPPFCCPVEVVAARGSTCFFPRRRLLLSVTIPYIIRPSTFLSAAAASSSSSRSPSVRKPSKQISMARATEKTVQGIDPEMVEEYSSQAELLQDFSNVSIINKAWIFSQNSGCNSQAMFSIDQTNLLANAKRNLIMSSNISSSNGSVTFHWSPFPVEMLGVSTIAPSPSGSRLLVVRNKENGAPVQLEIWSSSKLQKEIHIPPSIHGSVYTDGWFEGISWNNEENLIAYIAERPCPPRPAFDNLGFKKEGGSEKDCGSWKGQGDWEEEWGETYAGKQIPALFIVNVDSGEVRPVEGITNSVSVGQVVWAPSSFDGCQKYLVFVGWTSDLGPNQSQRKLGIKYCYNRPCHLYAAVSPFEESRQNSKLPDSGTEDPIVNLSLSLSSAFFPRFSPDGKSIVFLSAKSAVESGAHNATNSLHRIDWSIGEAPCSSNNITDVVAVVMRANNGCFPGLYCSSILTCPWLSDGCTMILRSIWGSTEVILSINVFSGKISRITPSDSNFSWDILALDGDNILAVISSPVDPPKIKYGIANHDKGQADGASAWDWLDVSSPTPEYSEKIRSLLSSLKFSVMKIPIGDGPGNVTEGPNETFEAIFVSSSDILARNFQSDKHNDPCNPLIVILHGGPHSVSLASFSTSWAFLAALGYNLLIVNYRGSLGFGEDALQSLPGKIGTQDVKDILTAIDHAIGLGLVDPLNIAVLGGSHGGFLAAHLIGQAPDRFAAAAIRNPVCNLSLMVGTTDIPDWCYVEAYGTDGQKIFTEAPSVEQLHNFFIKSPISHISNVKAPVLLIVGAQDLRVHVSNGLQYARALREKGAEVKVLVFPKDVHGIERPQSNFESFLNIGVWFKKHCNTHEL